MKTDEVTRKDGGMPEHAFLYPWWVNINGKRFISRLVIFKTPWAGIDVSRIHMPDDDRDHPHDHSRSFISLKLGWYNEWVYYNPSDLTQRRLRKHRWFSAHLMRYQWAHSITEVSPHLVTILFLGRTRQKSSYWTSTGKQLTGVNPGRDEA
jgi:hypothetical protein